MIHNSIPIFLFLGYSDHHWEELALFNISEIEVSKYRSRLTWLTVDLAKTDSPIVQVDFCLATKDEDESGLPEFVEGLIFYPHEEALDLLATHCLEKEIKPSWSRADCT